MFSFFQNAKHLRADSRAVGAGDVFLAHPGAQFDGRDFIGDAIRQGAAGVLWEKNGFKWRPEWRAPNAAVADLQKCAGKIAASFYGEPSRKLFVAAVTGTDGKTTTAHFAAQLLNAAGMRAGVVGTVGAGMIGGEFAAAAHTTPDAAALQQTLADFCACGAQAVVVEASSHGIAQGRLDGMKVAAAALTNISGEHLDYHGDFDSYKSAKKALFLRPELQAAIVNADDELGREIADELKDKKDKEVWTFGMTGAPQTARDLRARFAPACLIAAGAEEEIQIQFGFAGAHNIGNFLAAAAIAGAAGIAWKTVAAIAPALKLPPGRMEQVGDNPAVFIDYAHTAAALKAALDAAAGGAKENGRLICVFGCGGERDRSKRAPMGAAAAERADLVFVTSDNPRGESPGGIIAEIIGGIAGRQKVRAIEKRAAAIAAALAEARAADAVLIAGKGHEKIQEIGGERIPFDDAAVARAALRARRPA